MKKILLLLIVLITAGSLSAQMPATPGGKGQMKAPPAIGSVIGKLIDNTGKPVANASVIMMGGKYDTVSKKMKEVLLKGVSTKANGEFSVSELPIFGPLNIKISASGYKSVEQSISFMKSPASGGTGAPAGAPGAPPSGGAMPDFSAANFEKDLGKIVLAEDAKQLETVVVTAPKSALKMDIDKRVFNVEKNLVSAGGTAVDIMKNVPSVLVDIDGNVTLRNASPQIYVDGRPSTLSLDQIPADAIESVEVITNPSAKYDASGGNAGILNIVLKKNKKSGYNGNLTAGVDKRGGVNAGGGINVRQDKFNVSVNAFMNQNKNHNQTETHLENLLYSPTLLVDQYSQSKNNGGFLFGKVGVDYFATNRSTFSLSAIRVRGNMKPTDFMSSDSLYSNGIMKSYSERTNETERLFNATGATGGYKYLFPKQGQELTADVNFFRGENKSNNLFSTSVYDDKGGVMRNEMIQKIAGSGTNQFVTLQTDYVMPLKGSSKIETGLRAQLRSLTSTQGNSFYDQSSGEFIPVPNSSANYKNNDNVYAAYLSYAGSVKTFSYKAGLRGESSFYRGEMTYTKEVFTNNYPISLFPSLFLSQKLKNKQELQLNYSRRVNRPFFMQLIPFVDSSNQLYWTRGNPALKPEFTSSLEAAYLKTLKGSNTILASVYYKYTTNLITSFMDTLTGSNGIKHPLYTYANANSSYMAGLELTSTNQLTKWWDMNTNVNIYNSKINAENVTGISNEALWSWFAKFNANFKLPEDISIQFSGTYQSKTNTPVNTGGSGFGGPPMGGSRTSAQGYTKSNYGFDIALKKSFLKNNAASATLSVNDIFNTRINSQYSESPFFIQTSIRRPDSPMFRLTFSYRFGKMDMSLFKRKNMKGDAEGSSGAMQMQ
jgi:ferric enterobactin receptor